VVKVEFSLVPTTVTAPMITTAMARSNEAVFDGRGAIVIPKHASKNCDHDKTPRRAKTATAIDIAERKPIAIAYTIAKTGNRKTPNPRSVGPKVRGFLLQCAPMKLLQHRSLL
jgi:hypothetical protein